MCEDGKEAWLSESNDKKRQKGKKSRSRSADLQ